MPTRSMIENVILKHLLQIVTLQNPNFLPTVYRDKTVVG